MIITKTQKNVLADICNNIEIYSQSDSHYSEMIMEIAKFRVALAFMEVTDEQ